MNAVVPVTYTTPDGVERRLRSTRGTKGLMRERFGALDIVGILNQHGENALFEMAWFMMHDENGDPPVDLPLKKFLFMAPNTTESLAEVMAAVTSAMGQGQQSKNELEPQILESLKKLAAAEQDKLTTLLSGVSPTNASESETEESTTGVSSSASSSPSSIDTLNPSEEPTPALV